MNDEQIVQIAEEHWSTIRGPVGDCEWAFDKSDLLNFARALLAASASAEPVDNEGLIAETLHYPDHWDTAAYPDVWSALQEVMHSFQCSECMLDAPASSGHASPAAPSSAENRPAQDDVRITDAMLEVAMYAFMDERHVGLIASLKAAIIAAIASQSAKEPQ